MNSASQKSNYTSEHLAYTVYNNYFKTSNSSSSMPFVYLNQLFNGDFFLLNNYLNHNFD